jgi:sulfur carrier protein
MSLTLILNGQSRAFDTLPQPASLEQLIGELGLKGDRVAVEHNGEIVPRTVWAETTLNAGDRLEVVHFVGGGVEFAQASSSSIVRNKSSRAR